MRSRPIMLLPLVALLVGASAALAGASATVTVKSAKNTSLRATILVNQSGRTLYHLTRDRGKKVSCTASCASTWPPLILPKGAKLAAGTGVTKSKLGSVKRPDGRLQVTYGGMTLYRYAGDAKTGQTNGQGVGKTWYVVSRAGTLVKNAPASDEPPTAPPPPPDNNPYPYP